MVDTKITQKIQNNKVVIGIVGQGYVGLPLAMAFAKNVRVIGFDVNEKTIETLRKKTSHIMDVPSVSISDAIMRGAYLPTSDANELRNCDIIIICVPTPLGVNKIPDMSYIQSATSTIGKILHKNQYVVLESTTYPGTTEEILIPILEGESGLKAGLDFYVAFSPERIDPGNKCSVEDIPKIVGGMNPDVTNVICETYKLAIKTVLAVTNPQTAEAVKMVENIFRHVNIALINELAQIFEKMEVDTWEVVNAAATKPYGYMPFYPGPGVGGHCIPLDPYYLSYKAKQYGYVSRMIEIAGDINDFMKIHTINLAVNGLNRVGKKIYQSEVAVIGLSYKKDIDDTREAPAIDIIDELIRLGAHVKVYDPYARSIRTANGCYLSKASLQDALAGVDCAIFLVDHTVFKSVDILKESKSMNTPVIIDTKNIYNKVGGIVYLGIGKQNSP